MCCRSEHDSWEFELRTISQIREEGKQELQEFPKAVLGQLRLCVIYSEMGVETVSEQKMLVSK